MSAPDVSIVDTSPRRRRLQVVGDGTGGAVLSVLRVLERVALGPAWPLQPVTVRVVSREFLTGSRVPRVVLQLLTHVADRVSGSRIDICFNEEISAINERQILADFRRILEGILLHELREALLVDGALLDDPHAAAPEPALPFEFEFTVKA